ncbi:MAG: response regulator [Candidatus Hodarchaeales archaeon]
MCVQKSITERNSGVFEYELLMSYIENDPENLAMYLEIFERSMGLKEKVKELIKGTLGRNISPVVVIMARGRKEKRHALRVMTVEDDESTQRMYKMILKKYGIEIISEAFDGRKALKKYKELKERPEVVLLDYNLPYKNGIEVAKEILEVNPEQRIIFVTGEKRLGAMTQRPVVQKPFEFSKLVKVINEYAVV